MFDTKEFNLLFPLISFMLLTDKYAPKGLAQIIGNDEQRTEVKKWCLEFERGKAQKPLLLYGSPGIGKTACARAVALEFNWALIETNASDLRDPESLKKALGSGGKGLFGENRLLLLDEIDGAFDRGEVPELIKIIKENDQPMILTANDMWNKHLANVRPLVKAVEFKKVNSRSIADLLNRIAKAEGISIEKTVIDAIAKGCNGDVRSAIIDLQGGEQSFDVANYRDRGVNVFEAVRTVFKTTDYKKSINASENLDIDLDMFTKWIEENIPAEYEDAAERQRAFQWLAKADIMNTRIRRRQYWGLLRYVKAYSHGGVSLSKKEMYKKFTPYQFPALLKALSSSKNSRAVRLSTCSKIGKKLHCSSAKTRETLSFMSALPLEQWVDLSEDEAKYLEGLRFGNELKPNEKQKRKHK